MISEEKADRYECDHCGTAEIIEKEAGPPLGWLSGTVEWALPDGDLFVEWEACSIAHVRKAIVARKKEAVDAED